MKKHWKYLKYLLRHKWFVLIECFDYGLYWQGFIHDWHKFLPDEWFPYAEYFYGWTDFDFKPVEVLNRYKIAWLKHQHRAKHHWQNWVVINDTDEPQIHCIDMPVKQVVEMICDWNGAGKAITGKSDAIGWYKKNGSKMMLSDKTKEYIKSLIIDTDYL